jgi:hypothetical protein
MLCIDIDKTAVCDQMASCHPYVSDAVTGGSVHQLRNRVINGLSI